MDATTNVPLPVNEPVRMYAVGSMERASLQKKLAELSESSDLELTQNIGGREVVGEGPLFEVVQPHRHRAVLGRGHQATDGDVSQAVDAAIAAAPLWRDMSFDARAAIFLRAADLLAGPWRDTLNAATMLGQSKTAFQAEIDAACELIDFIRFNVAFGKRILAEQPESSEGIWNRFDWRPLEGFVLAITPFNFTAIAGNIPAAPALMGNTVVWKPSPTQQFSAHFFLQLLREAGLPDGVINMVTGDGAAVSTVALTHPALSGIHFTGSTATFQHLWGVVGSHISQYQNYPRLIGETGGKDFVVAHPSADGVALSVALARGAFEYQGQKCSAASRAYIPRSLWENGVRDSLLATASEIRYGDVQDFSNFGGAVIDRRAFDRLTGVLDQLRKDPSCEILVGGTTDDSEGFFVAPTVVSCDNPSHEIFRTEYFGPILAVSVFDDTSFEEVVRQAADVAPYALTGSIFARDSVVIDKVSSMLRYSAGNFYINDKPTGAVVGQQPFGGARASGTNDKAGSILNLLRWVAPRVIKETFVPPHDWRYPHMG